MRDSLRTLCDSFIANRDMLKRHFRMESTYIVPVCAAMLASKGVCPDLETLRKCRDLVRANTGVFSYFRGNITLPVITMLASCDDPEEKIKKITEIYPVLKKYFSRSEYLAYAAAVLADMAETRETDMIAQRGSVIYKRMRKEHPFLTSAEDSVFAVLLAFCTQNDDELIQDMETCYKTLKPVFSYGNYVQAMSHVITLAGGNITESCSKTAEIFHLLSSAGRKYGRYYELSVLAALAILPVSAQEISDAVLDADKFLSQQKGYGFWGLDKKTRLMHAAMLVSYDYSNSSTVSAAAVTATVAMVAAQQAAIAAAIAASSAAAASSSSN